MQKQLKSHLNINYFRVPLNEKFPISIFQYTQKNKNLQNLHYHSSFEIGLCLEGSGIFFIENRTFSFREGDVSFIFPNQPHIAQSPNELPSRWTFIDVDISQMLADDKIILNNIWNMRETAPRMIHSQDSESFKMLMKLIIHELEYKKNGYQDMVRHLVYALIYALLPLCSKDVERISETTNSFAIISPALAFITQNYNQEIRVSDLAGRCNLSETYFRTLFKTITGKTPVQYLEYVRMRMAKALLNSTNMPILSIALSVGYGSISSFNRTFKKEFGHTPTEYRCLIQQ